jgi:hypothetical protein
MTPLAHSLRACLPELAARTHDQLQDLWKDPQPDRCDWMLRALHEVTTVVHRLRAEQRNGEAPNV